MTTDRDDLRTWLRAVLAHMGWSGAELAKRIRVNQSTINRFINDPTATHVLSPKSLKAIELATGLLPLQLPSAPGRPARGLSEPEAEAFSIDAPEADRELAELVRAYVKARNHMATWTMRSRALEHAGFLPGDVLIVDINERARAHDVVCAQIYDWNVVKAETVFRIFEPPYLIAASGQPDLMKPLLVDDDRVVIKGVVVHSMRSRRALVSAN